METVRRSPGRPRKSQKTAASQAYRKPKVTLESTELRIQRGSPILPDGRNQETAAADSSDDGSLELSITDRLKNIRDFLIVEDPSTHPYFKDRLHEFETFMSDLASSKEMFNVNVYNDVKSMLRVHRERMLDRERDELMGPITFRVPSGSTTQSSNRDSVFSPNEARRRSDETDATSHHSGGWKEGARARFVNLYEDSDLLEFAPNLTAQMGKNTNRLEAKPDPVKRGKRPITEAFGDAGPASREGRRTPRAGERGRTSAEESLFTRKHPRGEHEDGVVGKPLHKQEERWTDEKGSQSRNNNVNLLGPIPNSGSGSLIPPEIADFQDENDGEPMASAKGERAKREADSEDEEFWPGDPVFMFGETNYLRALQSRQIEKDLAPGKVSTTPRAKGPGLALS